MQTMFIDRLANIIYIPNWHISLGALVALLPRRNHSLSLTSHKRAAKIPEG